MSDLVNHMVNLWIIWGVAKLFSKRLEPFYISTNTVWGFRFLYTLANPSYYLTGMVFWSYNWVETSHIHTQYTYIYTIIDTDTHIKLYPCLLTHTSRVHRHIHRIPDRHSQPYMHTSHIAYMLIWPTCMNIRHTIDQCHQTCTYNCHRFWINIHTCTYILK